MGKAIFFAFAILFFIGIIKSKGTNRLIWFFTGILFFQDRIILLESPTVINFNRFLIYTLLVADLIQPKKFYNELKKFPLAKPLIVVFVGMLCIGIFDIRHSVFLNIYRSVDEFIQTFLVIFLCYINFKRNTDLNKFMKFVFISSIILCLYGVLNYIIKSNPLDSFISKTYHSLSSFDQYANSDGRFRINSFVTHPIYYGYLSGVLFLLFFYGSFFNKRFKIACLIIMPIVLLNLILSNSRTPIIAFVLGIVAFILVGLKANMKIKFSILAILLCGIMLQNPIIQKKVGTTLDIFKKGGGKTSGSNLEMRTMQLEASYKVFLNKPITGNGFYYINENIGWDKNPENRTSDNEFEGFESYIYHLLIEQGLIGIIINILFFFKLGIYLLREKYMCRGMAGLGFGILMMFLTFIIGTGTVGSWIITMGFLGLIIANIERKHQELFLYRYITK